MLKEPRIIVAKVAHADQASGRVPAHVLQAKVKVREELVSAVHGPHILPNAVCGNWYCTGLR